LGTGVLTAEEDVGDERRAAGGGRRRGREVLGRVWNSARSVEAAEVKTGAGIGSS